MTTNVETIAFRSNNEYNKFIFFKRKSFRKGGLLKMTTADLIWRLIEFLLKDKETKPNAEEKQD